MMPAQRHQHWWQRSIPVTSADIDFLPEIPLCLRFSAKPFKAAIKPIKTFVGTRAVDGCGAVLNVNSDKLSIIGTDGVGIVRVDYPIKGDCPDLSLAISQEALKAVWDSVIRDGSELFLGASESNIRFSNGRTDVIAARVAMTTTKPLLDICAKALQRSTPAIEIEKSDFLALLSHAQALGKKQPLRLVISGSQMMTNVVSEVVELSVCNGQLIIRNEKHQPLWLEHRLRVSTQGHPHYSSMLLSANKG